MTSAPSVPAIPMVFFSFGGWKASLFGDLRVHGMEGVQFYTRSKVVTTRRPEVGKDLPNEKAAAPGGGLAMPTLK